MYNDGPEAGATSYVRTNIEDARSAPPQDFKVHSLTGRCHDFHSHAGFSKTSVHLRECMP